MEYRDWTKKDGIGRDISTSLLGYGCMRFPTLPDGRIDEVRAEKLLNTAREAGVNYFDTAFPYHGGESEPFVGRVIAKWPRESFYLATKLPLWSCKTLDEAKDIFEKQFERLGVDYIDFYLLHSLHKARYDAAKEMGIVDWLWEQKAAGRIRNFGFSCHDNAAGFEHILRDQPWDFCQLQYNYLDTDDRAEEIAGDRGYALTEVTECSPHHHGAHQRRYAGTAAAGRCRAAECTGRRRQRGLVGAALGGQPQKCEGRPLRHERRRPAGRQPRHLRRFPPHDRRRERRHPADCRRPAQPHQNTAAPAAATVCPAPLGGGHSRPISSIWNKARECSVRRTAIRQQWTARLPGLPKRTIHCVRCGKCEAVCPQHLPIRDSLAKLQTELDNL